MKLTIHTTGVSVALSVFVLCLVQSAPLYAKTEPQKAAASNVIPISASSGLQAADIQVTQDASQEVKITKAKSSIRNYSDGRVAEVKEGSSLATYSYQDESNSYTVYRSNSKDKTYTIENYVNGVLRSSLDNTGDYTEYYDDGKVKQRIVREGLNVFAYDYSYHSTHEIDTEGTWHPITALTEVNAYLSTANGFELYSTTTYTKADLNIGTPTIEETTYFMEPVAMFTGGNNKKVNFRKVQKAVLMSVKDPYAERWVKTSNKNVYTLKDGKVMSIQYGKNGLVYNFVNGSLMSVYQGSTLVIIRNDTGLARV